MVLKRRIVDLHQFQEFLIELRFNGTYRNVLSVRTVVDAVEVSGPIKEVTFALVLPDTFRQEPVLSGKEQSGSVSHGCIHDLSNALSSGVLKCGQNSHGQQHASTAVVPDEVQRNGGALFGTDAVQCPR